MYTDETEIILFPFMCINRVGPESSASKKRRAMAGCRTNEYRNQVPGGITELNCNIKVNKGDSQFMLDILDPPAAAASTTVDK